MSAVTCTIYSYNDKGHCVGMCGQSATVKYSRKNEETGPNKPKVLTFPRCKSHDTPTVQSHADDTGYTRETL